MLQHHLFTDRKIVRRLGYTCTQVLLARERLGIDETTIFKLKLMKHHPGLIAEDGQYQTASPQ